MDIMKLAEKAGFEVVDEKLQLYYDGDKIILKPNLMGTVTDGLKEFAALVRAEALEEAAKWCEAKQSYNAMHANTEFAAAIRARGEK